MSAEVKLGYKLTELGVIPEEWNCCSVEQLVSDGILEKPMDGNHGNIHPKSSDFVSDGIPFVMANNIKDGSVDLRNCSFIRKSQADNLQKGFSKPGDVLLTHKATIGQVAIVGCIKTEYIMLTPQVTYYRVANTSLLDNIYLRHFFESDVFQKILKSMSGGGPRSYIGITAQRLLPILLPPLDEQLTIAGCLSDIDALINCLDQLIAKKRDIKQAAMQKLLTGQQRLPGFSGEWEVRRLGDVLEKIVGGGTPSRSNEKYWRGEIPWVTVKDFATFNPRSAQETITQEGLKNSASNLIPSDTLITSTRMALGKAVIYEVDISINQDLKALFPKTNVCTKFLYYWFENNAATIDELGSGSTVKGISLGDLKAITFLLSSLEEQTAIANILSDMDSELATLEMRRDKARQLKQAMMQELLTGRIRLSQSSQEARLC